MDAVIFTVAHCHWLLETRGFGEMSQGLIVLVPILQPMLAKLAFLYPSNAFIRLQVLGGILGVVDLRLPTLFFEDEVVVFFQSQFHLGDWSEVLGFFCLRLGSCWLV